jgi:hypothetical protein
MAEAPKTQPDTVLTEKARQAVEKAESGDAKGAQQLDKAKQADPAGAEAAEQEASDGPAGRGLSR